MGRVVEFEQFIPPSLFGRKYDMTTGQILTDAHWRKLDKTQAEQDEAGQWTLSRYERRTDETVVEEELPNLEKVLDHIALALGIDPKRVRVVKEEVTLR